jgi:hypothetical protein
VSKLALAGWRVSQPRLLSLANVYHSILLSDALIQIEVAAKRVLLRHQLTTDMSCSKRVTIPGKL